MIRYLAILALLLALPLAAPAGEYDAEITVIDRMTGIMNEFADRMEAASGSADYVTACDDLADGMEEYGSEVVAISKENPEWAEEPPAEVQEPMRRHMAAAGRFEAAMQKAVNYANDNMDDRAFQESFKRLNEIIYNMYR